MSYTISRTLKDVDMKTAEERARAALSEHGFGVLTEIDVAATMKKKLGHDMAGYRILGACNPKMAWEALQIEPHVGAMLPCNVILRAEGDDVEISAVDPVASMQAIENDKLRQVAGQVRDLLKKAVDTA